MSDIGVGIGKDWRIAKIEEQEAIIADQAATIQLQALGIANARTVLSDMIQQRDQAGMLLDIASNLIDVLQQEVLTYERKAAYAREELLGMCP